MTGSPEGTKNISEGNSFNVKMRIDEDEWKKLENNEWKNFKECIFSVEKEALPPQKTEVISPQNSNNKKEDLLSITKDLRIYIKDNTGDGNSRGLSGQSRSFFYASQKSNRILQIALPLRVEVIKYEKLSNNEVPISKDEIDIAFELLDPCEDLMGVQGPRATVLGQTGETFLQNFLNNLTPVGSARQRQSIDDNCITDFAPKALSTRCREDGKKLIASTLLYQKVGNRYHALSPVLGKSKASSKLELARVAVPEDGKVTIYFRPPPILADNYVLQLTVTNKDGDELPLKDEKGVKVDNFKTPTITIWKRLKIQMAVHQKGATYASMKWDEIKNAYNDAYIEIEEPPAERKIEIERDEWFGYLEKYVYGTRNVYAPHGWRMGQWTDYKSNTSEADKNADFQQFSFPQTKVDKTQTFKYRSTTAVYKLTNTPIANVKTVRSGSGAAATTFTLNTDYSIWGYQDTIQWLPSGNQPAENAFFKVEYESYNLVPPIGRPDDDFTCNNIMGQLVKSIVKEKLGGEQYNKFGSDSSEEGKQIGMCYLLCHKPSPNTNVCGRFEGGKLFFFVDTGDIPNTFTHELGHALFLHHAATKVIKGSDSVTGIDFHYIARKGKGFDDSYGPAWNEHDSDDMVSCVMSYLCDYYDNSAVHPYGVDWHFCGVCIKKLRFYDPDNMIRCDKPTFRKLLYQNTAIKILRMTDDLKVKGNEVKLDLSSTFSLKKNEKTDILALYPQEGICNNSGVDPYKDLSQFCGENVALFVPNKSNPSRKRRIIVKKGKWVIDNPSLAQVSRPYMKGDIYVTTLTTRGIKGKTKLWFEITHGPSESDKIKSNSVDLEVN